MHHIAEPLQMRKNLCGGVKVSEKVLQCCAHSGDLGWTGTWYCWRLTVLGDRKLSYPSWRENGRSWWNTCRFPWTHNRPVNPLFYQKHTDIRSDIKRLSLAVWSTHTLHQVESFFREETLFAFRREAHCLPKLSLHKITLKLSETYCKVIHNKTGKLCWAVWASLSPYLQLESEALQSAQLGSSWPWQGFFCHKKMKWALFQCKVEPLDQLSQRNLVTGFCFCNEIQKSAWIYGKSWCYSQSLHSLLC